MNNLDDLGLIKKIDKANMQNLIADFPKQCQKAQEIGKNFNVPADYITSYDQIVLTGLGGSAIGADILRSYLADEIRIPILVNRNYTLPAFVNSRTLVIAVSYSGDTEETISAYNQAKEREASIITLTSNGRLSNLAKTDNIPCVKIPGGLPPRCALGYSFIPLLILLGKLGLIKDKEVQIKEMIENLTYLSEEVLSPQVKKKNLAKTIALKLYQKFPVIYASNDHFDAVAVRLRGQIAENGKALASSHVFPEMNHNEIVGWEFPKKLLKDFVVVLLRDMEDHPRIKQRMDVSKTIIKRQKVGIIEVESQGLHLLSRIFSLIYIGDWVSFYLAILNKIDPTPVEQVTYLKKELAKV